MNRRRFGDVHQLIHDLLDRHEANPGASRVLAYVDEDTFRSVEERDRFTQSLFAIEKAGGIIVQRKRIEGALVFGHVRLADPAVLYAHVDRMPAGERAGAALSEARARRDLPEVVHALFDEIATLGLGV